jgi:transposase
LLDSDHQARVVWDFCRGLDVTPRTDPLRSPHGRPGRPALDPRLAIALWLYATLEGVGSARQLAPLCTEHHAFRWLCGGVTVNSHTLADARVEHLHFLDRLLTHPVPVLREQGVVDLNRVAQDGTRVRASAGAASFRRKPTLGECVIEAEDQVARLEEEMDDDPSAGSRRQAAAREPAACERVERVEAALTRSPELEAKRKPAERAEARCSTTDAEATVMKVADGGVRPAYNVRVAVDTPSQVIVGADVLTTGSDQGQMKPMGEHIRGRHGRIPTADLADGRLASHADLEAVSGCRVTVYTPVPRPKDANRARHQRLPTDRAVIGGWRERMGTAEAKAIYQERAATVECVNAQARNRGLVRWLVRGVAKVKAVALWFAVAPNVACGVRLRAARAAVTG